MRVKGYSQLAEDLRALFAFVMAAPKKDELAPFCYLVEIDGYWFPCTAADLREKAFRRSYAGCTIKAIETREDWENYCTRDRQGS